MSARVLLFIAMYLMAAVVHAYPPAPFHKIYGTVRDAHGNALNTGEGIAILNGTGNLEIVRSTTDTTLGIGINYGLMVPMDSGTTAQLYQVTALRPLYPFTLKIVDVRPNDDMDGDGLTNLQEYLAGTYPLDSSDGLFLNIVRYANGIAQLRFLAITGRSYTLTYSPTVTNFTDKSFSLDPSGAPLLPAYRATAVQTLNIYVPASDPKGFFKLRVQ